MSEFPSKQPHLEALKDVVEDVETQPGFENMAMNLTQTRSERDQVDPEEFRVNRERFQALRDAVAKDLSARYQASNPTADAIRQGAFQEAAKRHFDDPSGDGRDILDVMYNSLYDSIDGTGRDDEVEGHLQTLFETIHSDFESVASDPEAEMTSVRELAARQAKAAVDPRAEQKAKFAREAARAEGPRGFVPEGDRYSKFKEEPMIGRAYGGKLKQPWAKKKGPGRDKGAA